MRLVRVGLRQLAAEQRLYWRNAAAAFFTFLLPILFLVFFGALGRDATVDGEPYADFFVPGMLAMAVVVTTFGGLAITLTIRRENGVLERIRGTPLPPGLYLAALIGSIVLVLAAEAAIVLVLGHLAFDVPLPARFAPLVGVIALGAACFSALGVALSRFVPNADGSSAVVNAVYLPMLFLSGAFFPVEKMPAVVRGVADALPLTHLLDVMRALFRGGTIGSAEVAGLGVLLAWGALGLVVSMRSFSWEPGTVTPPAYTAPPVSDSTTLAPAVAPAPVAPQPVAPARTRPRIADYVTLLKPRIMLLLVITTVGAMAFAAGGWPPTGLVALTVLGMCLATGGSSALNHWYDRDIDALMDRTRDRPIPSGRVAPREALVLGSTLGVLGVLELGLAVNWLTAGWAAAGFACYVLVYTAWLKRSTAQNIVWGGAAGAVPPLVGWAAVTGRTDLVAVALFAIIFLWTPPHFWALAILLEDDYRRAGVPMLPSVAGPAAAARQIVAYTVALLAASLVPVLLGELGWVYAVAALALGGRFAWLCVRLLRRPERPQARQAFLFSLVYLAALFVAMGADRALLG